ncbi:hypothetical protein [Aureibacter tunicatorum]|uniref:Uncharacterized protein n=1 Tax=Aureibacter tunicatorum TaxID=866807 RepID=A0AAE3XP06_9BACT|nr:hypothetical protein [Aureibacter tunicatorum]MDR6240078.1 hypothetical protein [Aureibacter tunicatorum]BDD04549.1 hypothetical protein AUTU_20320 [Aureibacter tunicatorum]
MIKFFKIKRLGSVFEYIETYRYLSAKRTLKSYSQFIKLIKIKDQRAAIIASSCEDDKGLLLDLKNVQPTDGANHSYFYSKDSYFAWYYQKLLDDGDIGEIGRSLSGFLYQYRPELYYVFAEYNMRIGRKEKAKMYFFLSGIYDDKSMPYVEEYCTQLQKGDRRQLEGIFPKPFLMKKTRYLISDSLKHKLKSLNAPEWMFNNN